MVPLINVKESTKKRKKTPLVSRSTLDAFEDWESNHLVTDLAIIRKTDRSCYSHSNVKELICLAHSKQ